MKTRTKEEFRLNCVVEDLCGILDRLRGHHDALFDLLVEKQSALTQVRMPDIADCTAREEALLRTIIEEEQERLLVTEEIGDLLDHEYPAGIRVADMLPHLRDETASLLSRARDALRDVAVRLARQNAVNRGLIEHSIGHVQLFMSRLAESELRAKSYGDKGAREAGGDRPYLMDKRG
ncbi:MAG: flagellar protein FlgN [Planctomycetota bacterium]